jgi:hypothetical protein
MTEKVMEIELFSKRVHFKALASLFLQPYQAKSNLKINREMKYLTGDNLKVVWANWLSFQF